MKYHYLNLLFALLLLFFSIPVFSNDIPILTFKEFEKRIENDKGGTVIYNFWATWCKPCVEEIPYFEKVQAEYKNKGVKVVFVNLDFKSQYKRKLIPFVEKNNIQSEVILLDAPDYNKWLNKIDEDWSGAIPATLIVNHEQNRREFYEQSFTYKELVETLKLK